MSSLSNIIFAYSLYISTYLWLFLTGNKDIKSINKITYITIADIENIYGRDICMSSTNTISIWI